MTFNKINYECPCGGNEADVQNKTLFGYVENKIQKFKELIQIKCVGCNHNHFLPVNDERCTQFFK